MWWKEGIFYEIYVRSFADSNNDGIGDLQGLISKLDYLKSLGIDAIWLTPINPSPDVDCGYDITNYTDIDPQYGTMEDFEELIREAHGRNMKVVMDLVLNHTSDRHPWFIESKSSKKSPKRDWHIWREERNDGPPNNWESIFGGAAWEYDSNTDMYYYHTFFPQQPDLNWRNPEVKRAMFDVARFWLDKGVDGFRLDAITCLLKDEKLTDNEERIFTLERLKKMVNGMSLSLEEGPRLFKNVSNRPEIHDVLKELRRVIDEYPDRMMVGEIYLPPNGAARYYGDGNELHLVFNFSILEMGKLDPRRIRNAIRTSEDQKVWFANALSNHDRSRQFTHFGDGKNDEKIAKITAALNLTLRGSPFLYYGEEIGMEDLLLQDISQFKDNLGIWFYETCLKSLKMPVDKAVKAAANITRDRSRSPMQWNAEVNVGFSGAKPWLPVNPFKNVAAQEVDANSLLSFYKRLINIRKENPALLRGRCILLNEDASDYLSFLRVNEQQACLVVLNMSNDRKVIKLDLIPYGIRSQFAQPIFSTHERSGDIGDVTRLEVGPYEVCIEEIIMNPANVRTLSINLAQRAEK